MKRLRLVEEKNSENFHNMMMYYILKNGFPGGSNGKESAGNAGDPVRSLGQEDPLGKGMATHSSVLAWEIPRTEEPGGLQSMGSQKVGHN